MILLLGHVLLPGGLIEWSIVGEIRDDLATGWRAHIENTTNCIQPLNHESPLWLEAWDFIRPSSACLGQEAFRCTSEGDERLFLVVAHDILRIRTESRRVDTSTILFIGADDESAELSRNFLISLGLDIFRSLKSVWQGFAKRSKLRYPTYWSLSPLICAKPSKYLIL